MKDKLEALLREGTEKIASAQSEQSLQEVKGALLGKSGSVTELPDFKIIMKVQFIFSFTVFFVPAFTCQGERNISRL